jgi:hypothetical protein
MSTHTTHHTRSPADVAYRRAFWSLLLLPIGLVGSFLTSEGLLSTLAEDPEEPAAWQALAAGTPALLVFALPAVVVWLFARRATRLGRSDGWVPGLVAIVVVLAFVAVNLLSFLARLTLE